MCKRRLEERARVAYNTVQYSETRGIATITLNRADKRNAISYELIDDLIAALRFNSRSRWMR